MKARLLVSATEADTMRLVDCGPRRDFLELAERTGADVVFRDGGTKPRGPRGKLLGPHVRQAWRASRSAGADDVIFADGEHIGLPLVLFLTLQRKRTRVVMLGHFVSKPWKWRAIRLASLFKGDVTLAVHSIVQQRSAERASRGRWHVPLVAYQVDTEFWQRRETASCDAGTGILAVGSEHRDYATLIESVRSLPVQLTIAAGSHWAREAANAGTLPGNVRFFTEPFSFSELREMYCKTSMVVVPLEDVSNQSGITVMLEAMSMGVPVIVTASRGQRECIAGPLAHAGCESTEPLSDRGPHHFGSATTPSPNGLYVAPGDVAGMRAAITRVVKDNALHKTMAANARATVEETFTLEGYVDRLASLIEEPVSQ